MLFGSMVATLLPASKDRIKVIVLTMLTSLTTDNFLMSLTRTPAVWCLVQILGYLPVPIISANLDVIIRSSIPEYMQGRGYACRNTLQFFIIPVGLFLGGVMVDTVCEPYMARTESRLRFACFGRGKRKRCGHGNLFARYCGRHSLPEFRCDPEEVQISGAMTKFSVSLGVLF